MADRFDLAAIAAKMQSLIEAFESHPENQPPTPNPTIFFTYDFVRNTYNQLKAIDAAKYAAGDQVAQEAVTEVIGRNGFTHALISDTSGKMSIMMGGGPGSGPPNFGPEIKTKSEELVATDTA
ncbi:hypothetical protein N7533_000891 [Penicillium manginii]|uniref:uncharacterized protein n=1 Tax=Penicillium manginii TaxID=203109 RepID=UPI0025496971|nr:uncharacterized protein N7533_000891 [Penicillium manginii]KAJ5768308.1 hypothetical protein N7533_000891 [Penicillium manginii]